MEMLVFLANCPSLAPYLHHPATEELCRHNQLRLWVSTSCCWLAESKPLSHLHHLLFYLSKSRSPSLGHPIPHPFPSSLPFLPPLLAPKGGPTLKQISGFGLCQSFSLPGLQALSLPCS